MKFHFYFFLLYIKTVNIYFQFFTKKGESMISRRYVMEFLGTFFLTTAIVFTRDPLAIGLMLVALVYIGGHVSGANFNPALSLAAFLRGRLSQVDLFFYWGAQFLGAFVSVMLFRLIMSSFYMVDVQPELAGATISFFNEALLTIVLVMTFLTVTQASKFNNNTIYGLAIGFALMAIAFFGGLFNPAVGLASIVCRLVHGGEMASWQALVVLIGGPLSGGAVSAYLYEYFND
jgi:aquaporin Z